MSLSSGLIAVVALAYMAIMFAIAFYGDRRSTPLPPRVRAWVYSLSLAVYCTSWTFFGAVGQAAEQLWSFLPIYLGPILLLVCAPWVLQKMVMISKQENITSIADFIAARYGKSQSLAVVVALICLVGVLPYIALQLKGIVLGVNLLIGAGADAMGTRAQDTALIVSLVLALFTIVFGTRNLDATEHHRGMVLAIAFESLVKLFAFLAVGAFVTYGLYDGFEDLFDQAMLAPRLEEYWKETINWPSMVVQTGVAMMAIICLPRQFHVTVVENIDPQDLRLAKWVFPAYLALAALFVVPIALAGQMLLPSSVLPDSFVISLPLAQAHPALAMLAFIGGASAATGMVIVASVALSTMVSNDMLLPWLLRRNNAERPFEVFRQWMLSVRRVSIVVILLLAYVSYRLLGSTASLATIGQIAFAAVTQLAPAMLGALYWKQANRRGVFAGLAAGTFLWFYTLILPIAAHSLGLSLSSFPGLAWLHSNPLNLPLTPLTQGVVLSLAANFTLFAWVSVLSRTRVSEHWQAGRFIGQEISARPSARSMLSVQIDDLLQLAARFVGEERARQSFIRFAYRQGKGFNPNQNADGEWIAHTERLLAGVLGASSTRAVVKAAIEGREMQLEDVVRIADEASEVLQFNRALLQGAIENITQGISVVDQSLKLVAWNRRYLELFNYPDGLIRLGRPIADIIRYNAERGLCGPGEAEVHVARRLHWMRQGRAHTSERLFPNGRVIELIGNPMPGGGFVMSFTDITAFREAEQALTEANEGLERRVTERTHELSQLNLALTEAKGTAELANQSKTRFLAAVSHDLMQPLNAARLFSAALSHQEDGLSGEAQKLVHHLDTSLRSAEDLISDLLDISRLENGKINPDPKPFVLNEMFDVLGAEFKALAHDQGLKFRVRGSKLRVDSDIKLLRRILQNFLTNAFRYAKGPVLLGVRRRKGELCLEVWDRGPGIPLDKQQVIFEEFKRLDSHQTRAEKGLGLGLAIADGLCRVLGHTLRVRSWPGRGSVFSVSVPLARAQAALPTKTAELNGKLLSGSQVLCIDNEDSILIGMNSLLTRWGCQVWTARNRDECAALLSDGMRPQLALVDYHLDDGETGTELMAWLRTRLGEPVPGVVISADGRPETVAQVHAAGLDYLAKPVKPAALRALLSRHLPL
ncbi:MULTISPECIES: PAS domain-containing hybrid sensor histidine kinase/response regulator [unclassified Pseudomonas]|uniref:hybrid sensor histidine kinase/response regulator n=1 Tax=unclassified Pseudomonas TaxID=196821 RepID=UPI000C87AF71|nr:MULTISPECIES: PAS domain-containing hybrid sensor histidine kinase/response regulator [unclassified Pseudomonas]PMU10536.1 hybrid sensor histidine kinase/response regulator [Pseudomonas sp. FW305-20]PMU21181.1 hybrid sensor histidine kinase/response regulator [Pseudomonas sp. FW305-122]PMU41185.1 hybrid sensor histidine kinase/response regulator [Pseudomonas sp. FW305-47B]PMX64127.1 hybrid sensor histidine kinase/response regulator [Pseudomonas sp. FW305-33]PMX70757.1 hybrid sensor histidin